MAPAKLVPEAGIDDIIIDGSKCIGDSETSVILELGGELLLLEEDLLGGCSAFYQAKLIMEDGGASAEV